MGELEQTKTINEMTPARHRSGRALDAMVDEGMGAPVSVEMGQLQPNSANGANESTVVLAAYQPVDGRVSHLQRSKHQPEPARPPELGVISLAEVA